MIERTFLHYFFRIYTVFIPLRTPVTISEDEDRPSLRRYPTLNREREKLEKESSLDLRYYQPSFPLFLDPSFSRHLLCLYHPGTITGLFSPSMSLVRDSPSRSDVFSLCVSISYFIRTVSRDRMTRDLTETPTREISEPSWTSL